MVEHLYEKELKQYAKLVVSMIGKGNAGGVSAIIQTYSGHGHTYTREIVNDLINLGICIHIPHTNRYEIIVSENELNDVWKSYLFKRLIFIKKMAAEAMTEPQAVISTTAFDPNDPVVRQAVEICLRKSGFSTAMLQTYLGKGHVYVSELALWLESIGVVGPIEDNGPRKILINSMEEFDKRVREELFG